MRTVHRSTLPATLLAATSAALLLGGCGSTSSGVVTSPAPSSVTSPAISSTTAPAGSAAGVTLRDGWVKSAPSGMTAIFGTLENPTDQPVTVLSAASPAAAMVELHEVAMVDGAMKMRPKVGGFVVPAHGTHELTPGGDHIMLMELTGAIQAGDPVRATLTLSDGATLAVSALGKDFAAGNESYQPSGPAK